MVMGHNLVVVTMGHLGPQQWLLQGAPGIPTESKAIILLQLLGCFQVTYFSHHKENKLMSDRLGILDLNK